MERNIMNRCLTTLLFLLVALCAMGQTAPEFCSNNPIPLPTEGLGKLGALGGLREIGLQCPQFGRRNMANYMTLVQTESGEPAELANFSSGEKLFLPGAATVGQEEIEDTKVLFAQFEKLRARLAEVAAQNIRTRQELANQVAVSQKMAAELDRQSSEQAPNTTTQALAVVPQAAAVNPPAQSVVVPAPALKKNEPSSFRWWHFLIPVLGIAAIFAYWTRESVGEYVKEFFKNIISRDSQTQLSLVPQPTAEEDPRIINGEHRIPVAPASSNVRIMPTSREQQPPPPAQSTVASAPTQQGIGAVAAGLAAMAVQGSSALLQEPAPAPAPLPEREPTVFTTPPADIRSMVSKALKSFGEDLSAYQQAANNGTYIYVLRYRCLVNFEWYAKLYAKRILKRIKQEVVSEHNVNCTSSLQSVKFDGWSSYDTTIKIITSQPISSPK